MLTLHLYQELKGKFGLLTPGPNLPFKSEVHKPVQSRTVTVQFSIGGSPYAGLHTSSEELTTLGATSK